MKYFFTCLAAAVIFGDIGVVSVMAGDGCSKGQRSSFPSCVYVQRRSGDANVVNNCDWDIVAKWDIARGSDYKRTISPGSESGFIGAWGAMSLRSVSCCFHLSRCHN